MKKTNLILTTLIVAVLTFVSCTATEKKEGPETKMDNQKEQTTQTGEFKENPHYIISVSVGDKHLGDIEIELFPDKAPKHVHNFDSLVAIKFYDGTAFHRVIPGFMIQGGDPNSKNKPKKTWGYGDPSQTKVPAEFNDTKHVRGIISAARSADPNSATSQFFIMHGNAPHLDGQYTAFGKVVKGIEVVDAICDLPREGSSPVEKVEMKIKRIK